jgi:beta-aspartyl-peptidase (threonine type)
MKHSAIPSIFSILLFFGSTTKSHEIEPVVIVHGGAGTISNTSAPGMLGGVRLAVKVGYHVLEETGSVLDAVEMAGNLFIFLLFEKLSKFK